MDLPKSKPGCPFFVVKGLVEQLRNFATLQPHEANGYNFVQESPVSEDLQRLVLLWPSLSHSVRSEILTLAELETELSRRAGRTDDATEELVRAIQVERIGTEATL